MVFFLIKSCRRYLSEYIQPIVTMDLELLSIKRWWRDLHVDAGSLPCHLTRRYGCRICPLMVIFTPLMNTSPATVPESGNDTHFIPIQFPEPSLCHPAYVYIMQDLFSWEAQSNSRSIPSTLPSPVTLKRLNILQRTEIHYNDIPQLLCSLWATEEKLGCHVKSS